MAPLAAAAAPRYSVTEIGTLIDRDQPFASDINNAGAITGSFTTGIDTQAYLYNNGITTNIGPVGSHGTRINNAGDIAGNVNFTAALFKNGTVQYLEQSDSFNSYATAINENGQIVGFKAFGQGQNSAFLYENGVMTDLNLPQSDYSNAVGINNAGQIVGNTTRGAYLSQNGSYTELASPSGPDSYTDAIGINDNGDVIGRFSTGGMTAGGFVYANGSMIDLGTLTYHMDTAPKDINNLGQVVGFAHNDGYDQLAFIYQNNVLTDLNTLIDPAAGYELAYASAINDLGQILASRCTADRYLPCQQVLLSPILDPNPVSEPGSTSMLLAGLAFVGFYQRRKHGKSMRPARGPI